MGLLLYLSVQEFSGKIAKLNNNTSLHNSQKRRSKLFKIFLCKIQIQSRNNFYPLSHS